MAIQNTNSFSRHAHSLEVALEAVIESQQLDRWHARTLLLGGSHFRGSLLLELAEIYAVDADAAMGAAVAVELLHNASLVHDDVIDRDLMRRGRPSAFALLGAAQSILLGDVLIAEVYRCLGQVDLPSKVQVGMMQAVTQAISKASRGQQAQLACGLDMSCTLDACIEWSRLKTGVLIALPVELAMLLAGAEDAEKLAVPIGVELGLAYQIMDDLFDWCGCKRGRTDASDLRNQEWTFARIAHRDFAGDEVAVMVSWIHDCFNRIEGMQALLPPRLRHVFAEFKQGILHQLANNIGRDQAFARP